MRLCFALLLFAFALPGADLTGVWTGQIARNNGEVQDISFRFVQKGPVLTGKLYGDYGSTPIAEAKLTGDQIAFVVITSEQSGNQINTTRLRFTGTIRGDEMDLVREREAATIAGNHAAAPTSKPVPPQPFHLKRLY